MKNFWKAILIVTIFAVVAVAILTHPSRLDSDAEARYSQRSATKLATATDQFLTEYGKLPDVGGRVETDSGKGIELLNILAGVEPQNDGLQNTRRIRFLNVVQAKGSRGGLVLGDDGKTIKGLFDSYHHPFTVI